MRSVSPCAAWLGARWRAFLPCPASPGARVGERGSTLGSLPGHGALPGDFLFLRRVLNDSGERVLLSLFNYNNYVVIITVLSPQKGLLPSVCWNCLRLNELSTCLSCIQLQRWRWSSLR